MCEFADIETIILYLLYGFNNTQCVLNSATTTGQAKQKKATEFSEKYEHEATFGFNSTIWVKKRVSLHLADN